ncbi:MAG: helix-turn-helix transcriptional regulator [Clostridia bacterium]|nr:helix-turn-helix transcriptional regulator [Clostridia bacterium]
MFEFNGGIMRHNLMQPVGFRYKEKSHSDYYTFFHFFDSVELNVSDNIFITTSHAVIIVDKGAVFESNSLISYPMHYSWFRFDCDKSDLDALGVELNRPYYPERYGEIFKLTERLQNLFMNKNADEKLGMTNIEAINNTICEIMKRVGFGERDTHIGSTVRDRLLSLRAELYDKVGERWSLDKMAHYVNYNKCYFVRAYKKFFGVSPIDDFINIKMDKAKEYLSSTEYKSGDISAMLGYNDYTQFSRQFKKKVGISPTEYRTKYQKYTHV